MSGGANVFEPDLADEGPGARRARLGRQAGCRQLGLSLYELSPGTGVWPYHCHYANEEMLIVLSGALSLRTPKAWRELRAGDVVSFRRGPEGAHTVANRSDAPARYMILSEMNAPEVGLYPDSRKVLAMSRAPGGLGDEDELAAWFRLADQVDYWEGEERPEGLT